MNAGNSADFRRIFDSRNGSGNPVRALSACRKQVNATPQRMKQEPRKKPACLAIRFSVTRENKPNKADDREDEQ